MYRFMQYNQQDTSYIILATADIRYDFSLGKHDKSPELIPFADARMIGVMN